MSSKPSQPALEALSRSAFVVMSTRTQKDVVSGELNEKFASVIDLGEGVAAPDWSTLQEVHAELLVKSADQVRQADQQHRANKARMSGYRRQRASLVGALRTQYRNLRKSVDAAYGEAGLVAFGIESPPPQRFVAVHEQMQELLDRVRDPDFSGVLPEVQAAQTPPDLENLAASLETAIQELDALMETIRRMQKYLDESVLAKNEALKENRRIYVNLARIQEGYYRLVGLDDLADRIRTEVYRTSPRRKPRETGASDDPPADGSSTDDVEAPPSPPFGDA